MCSTCIGLAQFKSVARGVIGVLGLPNDPRKKLPVIAKPFKKTK
jgi:hypothetical protein